MTTRNLTDSFIFMRNNSIQNRQYHSDDNENSDKAPLIYRRSKDVESGMKDEMPTHHNAISTSIQSDFLHMQEKMKLLISLHDRHLNRACLDDNLDEDREIELLTKDLTKVFVDVHKKLSQLVSSGRQLRLSGGAKAAMSNNIQSNIARTLQDLSVAFRKAQSQYLTKLKSRDERLKGLFEISDDFITKYESTDGRVGGGDFEDDSDGFVGYYRPQSGLTRQTQLVEDNSRVVMEREKEINQICKSIQELNEIFRDVAQMVTVQGSVIDRIDNNIEQTQFKVKEGLNQIQKAHKLQKKNRKMLLIIVLVIIVVILSVLLIFRKMI